MRERGDEMSLPDDLLDEPDYYEYCEEHGLEKPCRYCRLDSIDIYADAKIQDEKEGK